MSGIVHLSDLTLPRDPVEAMHAVTKQYVDRKISSIADGTLPPDDGKIYAMRRQTGATTVEYVEVSGSSAGDGFPVGTVMKQSFTDNPHIFSGDEWWVCDGSVFDVLDYPHMQNASGIMPYFENLLPRMSSDTEPTGNSTSASNNYQSQAISYRAFDYNVVGMSWRTQSVGPNLSPPITLTRKVPAPLGIITAYSIFEKTGTYQTYPADWILEVSEDGNVWEQIDSRTGVAWNFPDSQPLRQVFELESPYTGNGISFRWTFTKCLAKDYMHVYEIEFHNNTTRYQLPNIADDASGYSTYVKMHTGFPSENQQIGDRVTIARNDPVYLDEAGKTWLLADGGTYYVEDYPELPGKKGVLDMEPGAVVPAMSGDNIPPGYLITSSSQLSESNARWMAFSNDSTKCWITAANARTGWIQIELPESVLITGYHLRGNSNAGYSPRDWTVEVSSNGTNWSVLDSRSGNTVYLDQRFEASNPQTGKFIRLNVTANTSGTDFRVYRLQYYCDDFDKFQVPYIAPDANGNRAYLLAAKS